MKNRLSALAMFLVLIAFSKDAAQARQLEQAPDTPFPETEIQIISPKPGQALQGSVPIIVNTTSENFRSVELTFGYSDDPSNTWFLIKQAIQPVTGTMLALWDTSMLTDGDFNMKLEVTFQDSSQKSVIVSGLRVRNYSPVETDTPLPPQPTPSSTPFRTSTPTITAVQTLAAAPASPTPLQKNPAELKKQDILTSTTRGALIVVGLFIIAGIINAIRRLVWKR